LANQTQLALNLLYSCKKSGNWEPGLSDKSVINLLETFYNDSTARHFFDPDIAYRSLIRCLSLNNLDSQSHFSEEDGKSLVAFIDRTLSMNMSYHWLIIPVKWARLNSTIRFRDFAIIGGNRKNKVEVLRRLSKITSKESEFRANHMENSRSPGFFDHPLLTIKIHSQTENIKRLSDFYAVMLICSIQAIYWGYVYDGSQEISSRMKRWPEKFCGHTAIYSDRDWSGDPFRYETHCWFDLEWLSKRTHQKRLSDLFSIIIENPSKNDLIYRFAKALRFFGKAIEAQEEKDVFEGLGITILYLMIAAESILLDGDHEKRSRLVVLLARLAKLENRSIGECASAIDEIYRLRSDFVHSGDDFYPDWSPIETGDEVNFFPYTEGPRVQNIRLVQRMIAKLIVDAPKHIGNLRNLSAGNNAQINHQWFGLLRSEWKKALGMSAS
jgi:hypothetical protein